MTLNQPLVGPKRSDKPNTSRGLDSYPQLQRSISPLNIGIGSLSPPGSHTLNSQLVKETPTSPLPPYREVALSDIPLQYAEEVDTFRRILKLPEPRESSPRSSTAVMYLDYDTGRQELRPRGSSTMLPLYSIIKNAFDKFIRTSKQQIYLRANTSNHLLPLLSGTN